jgi:diguanylate cyclase (GGDEF)-like protein
VLIAVFGASNVVCMLSSRQWIESVAIRRGMRVVDVGFASVIFYMLREPGTYFYLLFAVALAVTAGRRQVRIASATLAATLLVYGAFIAAGRVPESGSAPVVTAVLFFTVAVVYLFLSDRLRDDANLSMILLEEKRRSDVMVEITRSLSSSLHSREVLHLIVRKISEVFDAAECVIVRPVDDGRSGRVLASSLGKDAESQIEFEDHMELRQALATRDLLFVPRVGNGDTACSVVVIPLIVREALLGLIHIRLRTARVSLDDADARFIRMVSLTAANALRNAQLFEEMEHLARTDFMTGLANHRFFQETLSAELVRAQRHSHALSLLMLDVDHLKEVNDRFGHPAGDAAIRGVAQMIRSSCRDFDFAARYGGEEFAVILPETQLAGAIMVAERIRERIRFMDVPGVGRVTASIGISNYPVNAVVKEDLIQAADHALYQAKEGGRDRVSHFTYRLRDRA